MNNKFNKLTLAAAITAAFASQAHAGGYQINEQSVSGQGYGHAGRSSNVEDATIVYGNPAGMSFLDRAQISLGGTYLNVKTDIDNANATRNGAPVTGSSEGDMVPGTLIPYVFYAQPVNEQLAFGFGVYAPFGSKTDYEDGFIGRNLGNYTELTVMSAQPTVSYRFNDQFSVGAGVTFNRVEGELKRQVPTPALGLLPGGGIGVIGTEELDANISGEDDGIGYNLGVIYQPVPETTLGLTYRSKVSYTLEGDYKAVDADGNVYVNPLTGEAQEKDAQLDLDTPETINFSVTQQMSEKLKLMFGASWTRWDRFDEILVTGPQGETITSEEQDYSDAWAYAVGGEYQLNPQLVLRAGVTLDKTPTSDQFRSARIPSDDRRIFSLGAGWSPTEDMTIDVAYSYLTERSTQVDQSRTDASDTITSTYSADYKNEAHGFGAQLTYRF